MSPAEQIIDGFLDMESVVRLEHVEIDKTAIEQRHGKRAIVRRRRGGDGLGECIRRDRAVAQQPIAKTIAAIHDGREHDPSGVKVNGAKGAFARNAQTPRLLAECEELQHIGETGLVQTSANRHQRKSSITRPPTSLQSQITFSRSRK